MTTTTTTSPLAVSPLCFVTTNSNKHSPRLMPSISTAITTAKPQLFARQRARLGSVACEVALKPDAATLDAGDGEEENEGGGRIGARIRVKVPLKVYHVPKVPELDLSGMEGVVKQYVGVWKGKRISANLPFKVEFVTHVEGRGPVKFFAHLKEDEFDCIQD